jgi:hypothetical protein
MILLHILPYTLFFCFLKIFFSGLFILVCKSPAGEKNEICHGILVTLWA